MFNKQCKITESDYSQSLADNFERWQTIESGIKHTVPENKPELKLDTQPYIIGYCTDCNDPIYSNKGYLTLTRKNQPPQLFCNRGCANNYHNVD